MIGYKSPKRFKTSSNTCRATARNSSPLTALRILLLRLSLFVVVAGSGSLVGDGGIEEGVAGMPASEIVLEIGARLSDLRFVISEPVPLTLVGDGDSSGLEGVDGTSGVLADVLEVGAGLFPTPSVNGAWSKGLACVDDDMAEIPLISSSLVGFKYTG